MLAGFVFLGLGFYIRYAAFKELLKVNDEVRQDSIPKALVTRGIYKNSRNPAYLGIMLMLIGSLLAYPSLAMAALTLIFFVGLDLQAEKEECVLSKKFGKAYKIYKKKTPKWI